MENKFFSHFFDVESEDCFYVELSMLDAFVCFKDELYLPILGPLEVMDIEFGIVRKLFILIFGPQQHHQVIHNFWLLEVKPNPYTISSSEKD